MSTDTQTPMMRQYFSIKQHHRDAILFFRLGDFYEMFYEDAKIAARELDLTLTGRGKKESENRMPMCGIPYHAADNYILRLLNKGYKIAICEQIEDPALAKGLTKREVVKIITPGTVTEEKLLTTSATNYLAAVISSELQDDNFGLALADVSTGEFKLTQLHGLDNLQNELQRVEPREIIYSSGFTALPRGITSTEINSPGLKPSLEFLQKRLSLDQPQENGLTEYPLGIIAAAAILKYVQQTQMSILGQLNKIEIYHPAHYLYIDTASRRNLELTETIRQQSREGSLFWLLNKTKTAMGSRLLKEWINYPLLDHQAITGRLEAVAELNKDLITRQELSTSLKEIYDIERLSGRIANGNANPRDLTSLKESLLQINQNIQPKILSCTTRMLLRINDPSLQTTLQEICQIIAKNIVPNPPLQLKDGNIINVGVNQELDELRDLTLNSKTWLTEFELKEKERTGIRSLKVGYTSVFGYYLEISNANRELAPANYTRRQTLTNAERYITPELKEMEDKIFNASAKIEKLEYKLFTELRKKISTYIQPIQKIAKLIAELDVLLALAECAAEYNYCRPQILSTSQGILKIKNGRHPVVETTMDRTKFIPNDLELNHQNHFTLLFGPNMSGKSTYMRQIALLVIMAQIGSFVPAESMELELIDRLFTRIGAKDDLFAGQSTFMVEMSETATILKDATRNSLIIMDEIGRGTSTYDGMAIAWGVAEYLHLRIGAKTLFSTHYHELHQLAEEYPGIKNFNVAVEEIGDQINFLHKVIPGTAPGSYGIHVASIAGLPEEVIGRAKQILSGINTTMLETRNKDTEQLPLL